MSKAIAEMFIHALAQMSDAERAETLAHVFLLSAKMPPTKTRAHRTAPLNISREQIEKEIAVDGNISKAAQRLGCSRRTLQNHMRKHKIPPGAPGIPPTKV
jgi:transcriptional regulator of acetoin/glycerol metabolism